MPRLFSLSSRGFLQDDPFDMSGSGSPTGPKMVDAGKAAAFEGVKTSATTAQARIEAGRRKVEDARMRDLIQEQLSGVFATQETPIPPATAGEEDAIPGENESRAGGMDLNRRPGFFPIALDITLEYMLGNPRLQPAADENYHAACYGAFIRLAVVELLKVLAAACATDGITPAFEQQLEAVVHIMEADNDGHQFRLAYLRKRWDTQMHNGDTFALDDVWERYLRHGTTKNLGSPEFTELRALYKDRVYNTNIASVAKTSARQCFGGGPRRNDRDRDGGGGNSDKFKNARPGCETAASRLTVAKDVTKDSGKGKAKAEAPAADKAEGWGARPCRGRAVAFRGHLGVPSEQRCTGVVGMSVGNLHH
eukprot:jgi/Tetstr1/429442/TSEL_019352.t1